MVRLYAYLGVRNVQRSAYSSLLLADLKRAF